MLLLTQIHSRTRLQRLAAWAGIVSSVLGSLAPLPAAAAEPATAAPAEVLDTGLYATAHGELLPFTKAVVAGEDRLLFERDGEVLDREALEKLALETPAPVVDEGLLRAAAAAPADRPLELVVWLVNRPGARIAREVRERRLPAIERKADAIRRIHATRRASSPMSPGEEESLRHFLGGRPLPLTPEEESTVRALARQVEEDSAALRREVRDRIEAAVAADQAGIAETVQGLGGSVLHRLPAQNAVLISLPAGELASLAADPQVARIIAPPAGTPDLDNQDDSLGLTTGFWADGLDGGVWDGGVIDTGVQQNHPAFATTNFLSNFGTTDANGHGTKVAGIIASDDATYRGVAFGLDRLLVGNANAASGLTDADWMVSQAADDAEAINLSFGFGAPTADYDSFDQFWDGLVDDNFVLLVKSAGNQGVGVTTITRPASAFNILAVANMNDADTVARTDDVITASSSRGPTLGGRRKPDIAAPGENTMSTSATWAGANPDFVNFTGTSAATPHVTGGVLLVTDQRGIDTPIASKAVLLNTADAWTDNGTQADTTDDGEVAGSRWNATYGWGYLDLFEAHLNALDVFTDTVDDGVTPPGPDFKLYRGRLFAGEKATLVWNRHVGYNGSNLPTAVDALTDLDLIAFRESNGLQIDLSDSLANNVEQIDVAATEDVVLKVETFNTIDPDVGIESYALATEEGFQRANPPSLALTYTGDTHILRGVSTVISVSLANGGGVPAFNTSVSFTPTSGMSILSGTNPRTVPFLGAGQSTTLSWTVRWNTCPASFTGTLRFNGSSSSYGESFTAVRNQSVTCETGQ